MLTPDVKVSVGLENKLANSHSLLTTPGITRSRQDSSLELPDVTDGGRLAQLTPPFGAGLLLSEINGQAVVSAAAGAAETDVAHSVFASVLNASTVLDLSHSGSEEYYFLKEEESAFSSDYQELQRLSGSYNVSSDNLRPSGARQICAQGDASTVCLIYGADKRSVARHLLRQAHKRAAEAALRGEAALARSGLLTSRRLSAQQRSELAKRGQIRGISAAEVRGPHKFPELIGQPSNIIFVSESDNKN